MGDGPQARKHRNKGTMKEDKELHEGSFILVATVAISAVVAMDFSIYSVLLIDIEKPLLHLPG